VVEDASRKTSKSLSWKITTWSSVRLNQTLGSEREPRKWTPQSSYTTWAVVLKRGTTSVEMSTKGAVEGTEDQKEEERGASEGGER
jgi:hypothetical protein